MRGVHPIISLCDLRRVRRPFGVSLKLQMQVIIPRLGVALHAELVPRLDGPPLNHRDRLQVHVPRHKVIDLAGFMVEAGGIDDHDDVSAGIIPARGIYRPVARGVDIMIIPGLALDGGDIHAVMRVPPVRLVPGIFVSAEHHLPLRACLKKGGDCAKATK